MNHKNDLIRGGTMLLQSSGRRRKSPLTRGITLGRIQLVAKAPSFDAIPGPDEKAASRAAPNVTLGANTGPRPDAGWSKDIRDYYNAVMQEPVPRELLDLLARIATDKAG
jgi:hypothetical protein